jgi:para-nitrobenzyl esterase
MTVRVRAEDLPIEPRYHTPPRDNRMAADAGAVHGGDQPYPFGVTHQKERAWTGTDRLISDAMLGYFVNFIRSGNPNGAPLQTWPPFSQDKPQTLRIGDTLTVASAINAEKLAAIDAYMAARRAADSLGPP